jgi:hypothetical protein
MAKKVLTLETPFRPGEPIVAATDVDDIASGTKGKIELANGLGPWRRYWVKFEGGRMRGQVSHELLARPSQLGAWQQARDDKAEAALRKADSSAAVTAVDSGAEVAGGDGVASRIPAVILDRSKAAKARLLGG